MNDTTVIGVAGQVDDVRAYVHAVRAWLGDLPPEEVEELTAGMEADLAERAAESGGPLGALLGEPEAYAAELRAAAGLPPRVDAVVPDAVTREAWTDRTVREAHKLVARHPWLRELRPTWWLARGAVAGWVLAAVLGTGRTVLLPLVGAALSMWLGLVLRRREPLGTGVRAALGAGNALAVVLLLPMLAFSTSGPSGHLREPRARRLPLPGRGQRGDGDQPLRLRRRGEPHRGCSHLRPVRTGAVRGARPAHGRQHRRPADPPGGRHAGRRLRRLPAQLAGARRVAGPGLRLDPTADPPAAGRGDRTPAPGASARPGPSTEPTPSPSATTTPSRVLVPRRPPEHPTGGGGTATVTWPPWPNWQRQAT